MSTKKLQTLLKNVHSEIYSLCIVINMNNKKSKITDNQGFP